MKRFVIILGAFSPNATAQHTHSKVATVFIGLSISSPE